MTAKKFDINNLPDLKIRVAQEQIWKVLDCFKQLEAKEYPTCFFQDETILYFFYMPDLQRVEFSFREKNFIKDCGQEINLEQLEALAAEKQGNGLAEITGAFANDPEADWMGREIEGNGIDYTTATPQQMADHVSDKLMEVVRPELAKVKTMLEEKAKQEAQSRYDAALQLLQGVVGKQKVGLWANLKKALQIAAGLEQITPNTDTKSDKS